MTDTVLYAISPFVRLFLKMSLQNVIRKKGAGNKYVKGL